MSPEYRTLSRSAAAVLIVAALVLAAGCTGQPAQPPASQPPSASTTPAPASPGTYSATLAHGVSLDIPAGWTEEDAGTVSAKDYNRSTLTLARFTSPVTSPGDEASKNVLTVDFDASASASFEDYFNAATLAVEKTYDTADAHGKVMGNTLTVAGNKAYELDFQTDAVKGSYYFVSTDAGMYIFSFRGENKPIPVHTLEGEITDIVKSVRIAPA